MSSVRRAGATSGATLSALAIALGLAHFIAPRWSRDAGLDVWNYSAVQGEAREIEEKGRSIEFGKQQLFTEIELSNTLADQLCEGKLTLQEVTNQLAPLLEHRTGFTTTWRCGYRAPSFRHGVARYAITRVACQLRDDPEAWAMVSPRLEAEYAALK